MSNTSPDTGLSTRNKDEQQNLSPEEQSKSKLSRNELALLKRLPQQIKELVGQNDRIEHELQVMSKDIKQINQTRPDKAESRESIKQIHTQIVQLQTHVTKIGNTVDNAFVNIKSKKKGKKKRKNKQKEVMI